MGKNKKYVIPFVGLPIGNHVYHFDVGGSFFEEKEYSEVKQAKIKIEALLNKQSEVLIFQFLIQGIVEIPCDRCSEKFDLRISSTNELTVKIGTENTLGDEIASIPYTDSEIDLSEFIYEYIILSLPLKRVHPENKKGEPTCSKEALKIYNKYVKQEKVSTIDPRWEKLKNIIK